MTSKRLCTHFFLGSAASRSSCTACAAASSVAHDILALLRRRLHSHRTDAACCRTFSKVKLATQAQSSMRGDKVGLPAWKGLPDGLASHSAIRPAVPDAEVAGTFHAPPYQFFLPDLQGGALMSYTSCSMCVPESTGSCFRGICLNTSAMLRRLPNFLPQREPGPGRSMLVLRHLAHRFPAKDVQSHQKD